MTCLKRLTNKTALFLAATALAGCHAQTKPAPPEPVYANLGVLARTDPGWAGVALYDRMLTRLRASVTGARAGLFQPIPALRLSALPGLDLPGGAFALPQATLEQQRRLLAQLELTQVERLRERRAQSREQQLRVQQRVWQREAQVRYARAVAAAQAQFAQNYGEAFAADSARRLNLTLQIHALQKTVVQWSQSKPPTPRLDLARRQLASREAELARLASAQTGAIAALMRARATAIAQASADSVAYMQQQRAELEARLQTLDEVAITQQRALLAHQTSALLSRERQLVAAAVPTAGTLGPLSLPSAAVTLPAAGLRQAEARLQAQRARWVRGVYDETRAAAQDAAQQRGWRVNFLPGRRGEPDRTSQLAALLASRIWRS